jgi:hypothetical protein
MSMPAGAQMSEDGQWWWDETNQQWQAVQPGEADGQGLGGDAGAGQAGAAAFSFALGGVVNQIGVSDEAGDPVPAADRDTKVSVTIFNVGTAAGSATVTVTVDGNDVQTWPSEMVQPGDQAMPGDGFIHNCGAYPAGSHDFAARVEPGQQGLDQTPPNTVSF